MIKTLTAKCGKMTHRTKGYEVELICCILGCKDCPDYNGTEYFKEDHKRADEIINQHRKEFGLVGYK